MPVRRQDTGHRSDLLSRGISCYICCCCWAVPIDNMPHRLLYIYTDIHIHYTTLIQYIYTHRYTYTTHTHIYKTYTITRIYTYKTHTDIQLYIYNTHYIYIHIQICIYIIQHTQIYIHTLVYTYNTHIYHLIYVIGWVIWGDFSFS